MKHNSAKASLSSSIAVMVHLAARLGAPDLSAALAQGHMPGKKSFISSDCTVKDYFFAWRKKTAMAVLKPCGDCECRTHMPLSTSEILV
jgi:hypothetical protein